jgi:manganese-dependent ADP-ribose/CDP-alcohol diphosphatase
VTLFDALNVPHHHIIGNHCIYNMKKEMVTTRLGISRLSGDSSKGYYTISLCAATSTTPAIRLIALDTYDISTIAYPDPNHPKHIKALQIVTKHNHGDLLNPSTMRGNNKRFVLFNGGVDTEQLHWLDETLAQAAAAKEKVIIASHNPLSPTVANIGLCWNYEEIEAILHRYGSDVVILCLSGHTHSRGDATDHAGIHHTTLEAVLEAGPTDVPCYGTVSVFVDRIVIKGCGSDDAFATSEVFFNTGRRRTRSRSQRK